MHNSYLPHSTRILRHKPSLTAMRCPLWSQESAQQPQEHRYATTGPIFCPKTGLTNNLRSFKYKLDLEKPSSLPYSCQKSSTTFTFYQKKKKLNRSCYRGKKKINFFKLSNVLDTRTMQNDMSAEWGALYTTHTTPIFIPAESTRIWRYTQYYFSMFPIYSSLHFEIHILSLWQSKKMKGVEEKKIKLVEKKY